MGQLYPADAALIRHSDVSVVYLKPLAQVPSIGDFAALGVGLNRALAASELGGGWQPELVVAAPEKPARKIVAEADPQPSLRSELLVPG